MISRMCPHGVVPSLCCCQRCLCTRDGDDKRGIRSVARLTNSAGRATAAATRASESRLLRCPANCDVAEVSAAHQLPGGTRFSNCKCAAAPLAVSIEYASCDHMPDNGLANLSNRRTAYYCRRHSQGRTCCPAAVVPPRDWSTAPTE